MEGAFTQLEASIQNKVDELNMSRLRLESDLRIVNAELDYFKNIRYSDLKEADNASRIVSGEGH